MSTDREDITDLYQLAYFYREGQPPHRTAGLRLEYTAVRTEGGWRFQEANILRRWQVES